MQFYEVVVWTPDYPETMIQIQEDGSIGDVYRYRNDCLAQNDCRNPQDWENGPTSLFSHYIGKNKNQFRARAFAQLRRDIKNGELTNAKFVKLLEKVN